MQNLQMQNSSMPLLTALATLLVLGCGIAAFLSFAWGLRGHFVTGGRLPPAMRLLSGPSFAAFAWWVWSTCHEPRNLAPALACALLSSCATALFWWAVGATRHSPPAVAHRPQPLVMVHQNGPYAFVRHPFYLAYCLFWLGTALMGGPIGWAFGTALLAWYVLAARNEERGFAASEVAGLYGAYRARTGLILPRLGRHDLGRSGQ